MQSRTGAVGMIAAQLGEEWEGAQIDGAAQLREARRKLARQIVASQPPAMCGVRASHHSRKWYTSGKPSAASSAVGSITRPCNVRELQAEGLRSEAGSAAAAACGRRDYTRAKRWAHRRSPISGIVPNRPKPPKLRSHSASGQSAEQFQWSNPLGGHASLTAALAGSHLNVTLSWPAASAAVSFER